MMRKPHFYLFAGLIAFWAVEPWAQQDSAQPPSVPSLNAPVVVELFTSQSCSSCPPADAYLSELAKNTAVIALACHVTYWDHLDWKDTLSLPLCTQRQRDYAGARDSSRVYTPQMVVNGQTEFVGSNRSQGLRAITRAAGAVRAINLVSRDTTNLTISLPQLDNAPPQTLWLVSYRTQHTQSMRSGENRGRTITYTNAVTELKNLGPWNGQATTKTIPLPQAPTYAILTQSGRGGRIWAAGKVGASHQ